VLAAQQVQDLTSKKVVVIPTRSVAQGMSALVAFNPGDNLEKNQAHMLKVISSVLTLEITRSVRQVQLNGLAIAEGQYIGILDDDLIWAGEVPEDCLLFPLLKESLDSAIIATIYFGADSNPDDAAELARVMRQHYPELDVDVVYGGQSNYPYVISIEM